MKRFLFFKFSSLLLISSSQGDGRGLASGFYQAINLADHRITLNLNNTFTCFYQNWNLIEFLSSYLSQDIRRNGLFNSF